MLKGSQMPKIISMINKDIDKIELYKSEKNDSNIIINDEIVFRDKDKDMSFLSLNSDTNTIRSNVSHQSQMTFVSEAFNEEKDLDLPYFSPTKYISLSWRLTHSITYFLYNVFLLISSISLISSKSIDGYIMFSFIAHIFYFISASQQWYYFKRGCCCIDANLNSKVKANIDKSFRAKVLRSEEGFKHFFSLCASCILIYGNVYFFAFGKGKLEPEFWNINLIGSMIICLSQILKLEKILTESKQFAIQKDLSKALIEIFLFFGALCYGTLFLIQIMYYNIDIEFFEKLFPILQLTGSGLIVFSGLCLFNRYFFSGYDDLNASDLSNITI
jgi:hypothetical protein